MGIEFKRTSRRPLHSVATRPAFPQRAAGTIARGEPVEIAFFSVLLASLAWVPFWYGSNDVIAWGINAILFPGLVVAYETSLLVRRKNHPIGVRELAIPAVLFMAVVAWIFIQILTWGSGLLANPIWTMAAEALGRTVERSVSVDRDLTNLALLRLLTAASAFWLALQLCRNSARALLLIGSIMGIGCAYAGYGLVAMKWGQLPWLDIPPGDGKVTATFVNHNLFAAFAGICLVAAVGRVLQRFLRAGAGGTGGWRHEVASLIQVGGGEGALPVVCSFVILAALLLTGSRGGVIATGIGLLVLCILAGGRGLATHKKVAGSIIFATLLIFATALSFGDTFVGNLQDRGVGDANRVSVYWLTLRSIFDLPFVGYGYGTFADVFPMYRDHSLSVEGVWGQAHDTYLEVFQGLGLIFGATLIGCVALLVLRCVKGAWYRQENAVVPQVAVAATCLLGAHSLVDFGLQMQAVSLTLMVLLGAGVAQSESSRVNLED